MNATVNPGKHRSDQQFYLTFLTLLIIFVKKREITKIVME